MTSENVCKFHKFGFCRMKNDCPDFHPSEDCTEKVCNVSKCVKRHPQPCRYFQAGSCRFGDSCKYNHKKQLNDKELTEIIKKLEEEYKIINNLHEERIKKLESENRRITNLNEKQADTIMDLNTRMCHLEKEYVSILKSHIKDQREETEDEDNRMDEDTLVSDDHSKSSPPESKEKEKNDVSKNEVEAGDIGEQLYSNLINKNLDQAKECLDNFRNGVNLIFGNQKHLPYQLKKVVNEFNIECNKIKSSRNTVYNFRKCIADNMEIFITQIINFQKGQLVNFQNNQQNGSKTNYRRKRNY